VTQAQPRILVTGANSGIGREIVRQLAAQGAQLILACRDAEAGARTIDELREELPDAQLEVRQVDVSSPPSIRAFAHRLTRDGRKLDVLVNNAGVHLPARRPSPEGLELTFATNVLGTFLTALELLPLLEAGAAERGGRAGRIVNVASTFAAAPELDDPQFLRRPYNGQRAYQESKAGDRMLTRALARRLAARGVTVNSMAPGLVQTRLFRDTNPLTRLMIGVAGLLRGKSVEQGADTAVWLAADPAVEGRSGGFHSQRQERPCEFADPAAEERLWRLCEELTQREHWPCPPVGAQV